MAGEDEPPTRDRSRFLTGAVWAVLLLGLWLWGRDITGGVTDGGVFGDGSVTGSRSGEGPPLPDAHDPLEGTARPVQIDIQDLGIHASVIPRSLDSGGAVAAPPYATPQVVGWYGDGPTAGAEGAAVLVGHVDTDRRRAVFYSLSSAQPGTEVEVTRGDGLVAEFTVESAEVVGRAEFDAGEVYGPREDGRAELRLLTCGGTFDRDQRAYTSNVVVSAYLTGTRRS
ncbi:class F sortase [Streptomyces sp. N2-109]|uniref:Class F sortase n=1 Tax=Streptomyces gossypii TaxID=2883101 RepID=A0ABT2JTL5_9ACTN|nr:class F sortase [Streptomyces gossypii]MCT2591210.1 class F sortase [Streptomyces gossypii]